MSTTPSAPAPVQPKDALFNNLQPLDREAHKSLRLSRTIQQDLSPTAGMNALLANAVEFFDICREYPIVFVRTGNSQPGEPPQDVAPVAVLGLKRGENLYLGADGTWAANYLPASLRAYPFALVKTDENNYVVCYERDWAGFSEVDGDRLFTDEGQPTEFLLNVQKYLETLDAEMQRTRAFGKRLLDLGLLQEMRFDATLNGGEKLVVDGFLAINEQKLTELPDATLGDLHRNGLLALIHAQMVSMGNMRRLVEKRVQLQLPT